MTCHLDLFSGIGGFALAARWNEIETIQFVEKDQRCIDFLLKSWPGVPIHDDIKTFHYDGRSIFLLTGGVPCQPASRAGKQRGKDDDRWLWPEAVRVLGEVKPDWAIFENPPGIGDVGLAGILSDVEVQDYEVRVFGIPACAVGSPQIRMRYWIVCRNLRNTTGRREHGDMAEAEGSGRGCDTADRGVGEGELADARNGDSKQRWPIGYDETEGTRTRAVNKGLSAWDQFVWMPCADGKVRRAPDNSFGLVDGLHRSVLGALGNSIVPQVAYKIIKAIIETDRAN